MIESIEPLKSRTIAEQGRFNYCLKRQSSCPGLYAHVIGRLESCQESSIFENRVMNGEITSLSQLVNKDFERRSLLAF